MGTRLGGSCNQALVFQSLRIITVVEITSISHGPRFRFFSCQKQKQGALHDAGFWGELGAVDVFSGASRVAIHVQDRSQHVTVVATSGSRESPTPNCQPGASRATHEL